MSGERIIGLRIKRGCDVFRLRARQRAFLLGSAPEVDVRIAGDRYVSGIHCALIRRGGGLLLVDRSTNGCWVDGVRVERAYLHDGCRLSVGTTHLIAFSAATADLLSQREARFVLGAAVRSALARTGSPRAAARSLGVATGVVLGALRGGRRW